MANTRFTLSTMQAEVEAIVDKFPNEQRAGDAIAALAESKGLRFNVVRRAYRTVQNMRTRRKPIE